jgi:hypothetical protein
MTLPVVLAYEEKPYLPGAKWRLGHLANSCGGLSWKKIQTFLSILPENV